MRKRRRIGSNCNYFHRGPNTLVASWVIPICMRYEHADYKNTDDRGRVTLGKEHANSKVAVAWVDVSEPDPSDARTPPQEERDKLGELWRWSQEHDYKALDFDVQNGRIYTGGAEWVDTDVEGLADE